MAYLVKSHWKKIILSLYVVVVLVISATVKAETTNSDLKQELRALTQEINFMKERRLLDTQAAEIGTPYLNASVQSLIGYFEVTANSFGGLPKVYFVALPSHAHFEVDPNSKDIDLDSLEKDQVYQIEGFVIKQALPSHPQFVPNLIVTSIKIQR